MSLLGLHCHELPTSATGCDATSEAKSVPPTYGVAKNDRQKKFVEVDRQRSSNQCDPVNTEWWLELVRHEPKFPGA